MVRRWGRGGLECAFEAEGPERAEVEARAELGVRGRAGSGNFGVLGGVVEVAQIGEEREAAREKMKSEMKTGTGVKAEPGAGNSNQEQGRP